MNLRGIGTDIVEHQRVRSIPNTIRFCEYLFTSTEQANVQNARDRIQYISSRFAAKEAVIKASPEALTYQDFEIQKIGTALSVIFVNPTLNRYTVLVSIAHEREYSVSFAIVCTS